MRRVDLSPLESDTLVRSQLPKLGEPFPPPINAEIQLLDSSARKPLIFMDMNGDSCGLRVVWGALRWGDYWPAESKSGGFLGVRKNYEVRKNPREPQ